MLLYRFSPSEHFNILNIGRPRPAKRKAALWLTPQQKSHSCRVPCLTLKFFSSSGRDGQESAQRKSAQRGELSPSATFPDDCFEHETPFLCLVKEAARRLPFIRKAASTLCDLIRECPLLGDGSVQRQAYRVVYDFLQDMHELEEALASYKPTAIGNQTSLSGEAY